MGGKIATQFLVLATAFFGLWLALSQINFITPENLDQFSKKSEKKLSQLILEVIQKNDRHLKSDKITAVIDSIGRRVCEVNHIIYDSIRIHVIINSDINAFALPDRHMVIYTGLINQSKNPEEIAGVMAHEIGHMEKNHVMKKLGKEIGLTMLFAVIDGGKHFEIIHEMTRLLSSTAFDRTQESEADQFATEALAHADIDPENLANFLFRISRKDHLPEELVWLSTHPNSEDRAAEIIKKKKDINFTARPVLNTPWDKVKEAVREDSEK